MKKWMGIGGFAVLLLAAVLLAIVFFYRSSPESEKNRPASSTGLSMVEDGKWDLAAQQFEKEISLNPKNPQAHLQLAILYGDYLGKSDAAIQHYEAYLTLAPTDEKAVLVHQWLERVKGKQSSSKLKISNPQLPPAEPASINPVKTVKEDSFLKEKFEEQGIEIKKLKTAMASRDDQIASLQNQIKNVQVQKNNQETLYAQWVLAKKDNDEALRQIELLKTEKNSLLEQFEALTQSNTSLEETVKELKSAQDRLAAKSGRPKDPYPVMLENKELREKIDELETSQEQSNAQMQAQMQTLKKNNEALKNALETLRKRSSPKRTAPPVRSPTTAKYRVRKGESLRTIASSVYGNGDRWRLIYYSNRNRITDPNVLSPGQIIEIPMDTTK